MKHNSLYIYSIIGMIAIASLFSCSKETPSMVYFPDMYYPVAYDPLQQATLAYADKDYKNSVPLFQEHNGRTALDVVPNTVYRTEEGIIPTDWERNVTPENYNDKYAEALAITQSPLDPANKQEDIARGKDLFNKTCAVCHGKEGDGQGPIVKSNAYGGVPNYRERDITVGSVYFVIRNGRNAMGSYAGQLETGDRWRVAEYVINEFKK